MERDDRRLPERRMFSMGNGKIARKDQTGAFCDALVEGCLDARVHRFYDFTLGFAACLDAISRGTLDLDADPIGVVMAAHADVHNVTLEPNAVTDVMRFSHE